MGILDRFFGSQESIASVANIANKRIIRAFKKYLDTIPEKQRIINAAIINIQRLKELLNTELVDLKVDENAEMEVIRDLKVLRNKYPFNAADKLYQTLRYAERKYEYILGLILQIHSILKNEFHLVSALERNLDDRPNLIELLRERVELEVKILKNIAEIDRINGAGTFSRLFLDFIKSRRKIQQWSAREKRLIHSMIWYVAFRNKRLLKSMNYKSDKLDMSLFNVWGKKVNESLERAVGDAVAKGLMDYNSDADFEFVNKSMFEDLVREVAIAVRNEEAKALGRNKVKGAPSKRMVEAFVHDFRQWFNSEGLRAA
jgi:hypothetical protein